jgi:hypothetical protein
MSQEDPAYRLCLAIQHAQDAFEDRAADLARAHLEGLQTRLGELSQVAQHLDALEHACDLDNQALLKICAML